VHPERHDALLGVLGQVYADVYLAQRNRPDGKGYFDFVMSEVHGLHIKELHIKELSRRVSDKRISSKNPRPRSGGNSWSG
jgi:hypothetical protein